MNREKIRAEVISAVKQVVDNVRNEECDVKTSNSSISEDKVIGDFDLDSLERIALTEVLERQFNLGYTTIGNIQDLTVGELCDKVIECVEKSR